MNIIYILWLRQLKRYWRSKSRLIGSLGQPLIYLLGFGLGMRGIYTQATGSNYINFLTPGIISQAIMGLAIFSGFELILDKQFGFLKETLVAPVPRFQIILGRTLGGATIATLQGLIVLILSSLLGFRPSSFSTFPLAILTMFLIAFLYTALGTAIASKMKDFHGFQLVMTYLVLPSFFFSGAIAPLTSAPALVQNIARYNPLTYGVDALREILTGTTHLGLSHDILILTIITAVLLIIASSLFSRIEA